MLNFGHRSSAIRAAALALAAAVATTIPVAPATAAVPIRLLETASAPSVEPSVRERSVAVLQATGGDQRGQEVVAGLRDRSTAPFRMVGVTWKSGTAPRGLEVYVRQLRGQTWSGWEQLGIEPAEGPTREEERAARAGTSPLWVGHARGVEVKVLSSHGLAPQDIRVAMIDPGTAVAASTSRTVTATKGLSSDYLQAPPIITREQWGADPTLVRDCYDPPWGTTIQGVFVHHTAGTNSYAASDSPAIVRGIHAYHVESRGWCDIGYNFLVDRYGQIFEGRRGGWRKPIRGAHSGEYNLNTAGISLMGTFEVDTPPTAMKEALTRLVSWVIGSHYRDPLGTTTMYSSTTGYAKVFNVISGHRDSMDTTCPGDVVYAWLPTLRQDVAARIGSYPSHIYTKWQSLGGEAGWLGSPFVGERTVGAGRRTVFNHGAIYWLPGVGAHEVHGAIRAAYLRDGGARSSALGWPTTDTQAVTGGYRVRFQHGYITHYTATQTTLVTYS